MEVNYSGELQKLMAGHLYNGCVIKVNIGEYIVFGKSYKTLQEAKDKIDESYSLLEKSIK